MEKKPDVLTAEELEGKLIEILQSWPLYRKFSYTGASNEVTHVPEYLRMYCSLPTCEHETIWETEIFHGNTYNPQENNKTGFSDKTYTCRNCSRTSVRYWFYWKEEPRTREGVFYKVGQYPPLEDRVSTELSNVLGDADLNIYRNALRLRNFNLGIGAVSYMRRLVENHMNDMLDILHTAARERVAPAETLKRLDDVKIAPFTVKVEYAEILLPESLRRAGLPNPIGILHALTSDGLHAKTDEECVDIFDRCRKVFEYVFKNMRAEIKDSQDFLSDLSALTKPKAKP
jgi:hypothetical protein